jgi:hypothetical protein
VTTRGRQRGICRNQETHEQKDSQGRKSEKSRKSAHGGGRRSNTSRKNSETEGQRRRTNYHKGHERRAKGNSRGRRQGGKRRTKRTGKSSSQSGIRSGRRQSRATKADTRANVASTPRRNASEERPTRAAVPPVRPSELARHKRALGEHHENALPHGGSPQKPYAIVGTKARKTRRQGLDRRDVREPEERENGATEGGRSTQ